MRSQRTDTIPQVLNFPTGFGEGFLRMSMLSVIITDASIGQTKDLSNKIYLFVYFLGYKTVHTFNVSSWTKS